MSLDLSALRRAAKRLQAAHDARSDARRTTGATALIRAALPEIRRLRDAEGLPWAVIAAALAEQGVRQGRDGQPITADRLIALVRHVEGQQVRAATRQAERAGRPDLTGTLAPAPATQPEPQAPPRGKPRLAPELQSRPPAASDEAPLSEAEIRRLQAEKHRHLFKKD
ncbi:MULTISPECIES: hypothetical protein [Methylorubrum]|uniref:Uncharacterized protein n=2 Tax=Methylorubrum TaxID=2282523 RepID=C5B1S7_METEA|nr:MULTISPECIES: hypothetical protein [Methylorubrum]MBY0144152.1 hypothetical protein [Methylorubrum populi]ACS39711.1 Hypothetical protein MexAM1_META1p1871 [Methylorubrum extorquens AM1]MBK3405065.1 hypothetical protein [Methylorubrum rhodesianum]MCP1542171.1 hypothetical protein [Methylorubrum extorquens]MCP1590484.1 hypothetical protein [Methylorubrum extorquens]